MKKIISLLLLIVMTIASIGIVGCDREGGLDRDETKSLLNIGVMNAGMGRAWADEAIKEFEELYANEEFETGKKGVQVVIDARKDEFVPTALRSTMAGYKNAIYFVNQSDYEGYVADSLLADITQTINEKVYDENGDLAFVTGKPATQSIYDTMHDYYKGQHEIAGKYYGIPWCSQVNGIIYDADLFDKKGYYFDANGNLGKKQADIDAGNCGAGPDGKMNTADDGMPATYAQFRKLLLEMKRSNTVIPFTWAGTEYQRRYAYEQIWANYEGANDFMLNYTFEGTDAQLGAVTPSTAADVLSEQEGRKAGAQFFYDIVSNGYYSSEAFKNSYTEAQTEYIQSVKKNKQIAFFMEGGYWENEARATFDELGATNKNYGYGKRDFRYFPVPNFVGVDGITDQTNTAEPEVILGGGAQAMVFITARNTAENPELQLKLAKLFLQFINSRSQLADFTKNTGANFRNYDFTPTADELASWTKYSQSIWRYFEEGATFMPCLNYAEKRKDTEKYGDKWTFTASGDNATYYCAAAYFANERGKTVEDCFTAIKKAIKAIK